MTTTNTTPATVTIRPRQAYDLLQKADQFYIVQDGKQVLVHHGLHALSEHHPFLQFVMLDDEDSHMSFELTDNQTVNVTNESIFLKNTDEELIEIRPLVKMVIGDNMTSKFKVFERVYCVTESVHATVTQSMVEDDGVYWYDLVFDDGDRGSYSEDELEAI